MKFINQQAIKNTEKLPSVNKEKKSGNYWPLEQGRNKELILRFPYLSANHEFDVFPNTYEIYDLGNSDSPQDYSDITRNIKVLRIIIGRGDKHKKWLVCKEFKAFFIAVPFLTLPDKEFKAYKRVDILQYIYFLYTQPEQFVSLNTEMILKQYLRTSDFIKRTMLSFSLFEIFRSFFPYLGICSTIFREEHYDKVLSSRMIAVPPIISNPKIKQNEENLKETDAGKRLMAMEQAKGLFNVHNHIESTIRIYQKDLNLFIRKNIDLIINHLWSTEDVKVGLLNRFIFPNGIPMFSGVVPNNAYSIICEFQKRFDINYYFLEENERRNILNLLDEIVIWNLFLRIFDTMRQFCPPPVANTFKYDLKDFFIGAVHVSPEDLKGTPHPTMPGKFTLSNSTKKKVIGILTNAVYNYIATLGHEETLIKFHSIAYEFGKHQQKSQNYVTELGDAFAQNLQPKNDDDST